MTHRPVRPARAVLALTVLMAYCLTLAPPAAAISTTDTLINEIQVSTSGTDWEFFELQGTPGSDLSSLTLVEVESDDYSGAGTIDKAISLAGQTIPADGFWLGISPEGAEVYGVTGELSFADNSFENSTATYFLVSDFTGAEGDDLDTDNDGNLDVTPWTQVLDAINLRDDDPTDFDYGATSVGPDGWFLPSGTYRCPDAPAGTFGALHDFGTPNGSPGASNTQCTVPPTGQCGDPATLISAVQGDALASPLLWNHVVVEGIVVGDFQWGGTDHGDLGGFFLQEELLDNDGNPMTSEGIFVFDDGGADVAAGDRVRVNGYVFEYYGLTRMAPINEVLVCDGGHSVLPAPVGLPVESRDDLERYEGMKVIFGQSLTISEYYNFDRFGEIVLTTDRQFQPTAIYEPYSAAADELAEQNALSRIQLDDGRTASNPDPARHPNGLEFTLDNRFRGGDLVEDVIGALSYSFGAYEIQPTAGADYTPVNLRPPAPEDVGGEIKAASFNVLNYFTTLDDGPPICGPEGGEDCRGANTAEEFERQQAKIVEAMCAIDADVFGLMELENQNPDNDPEPADGIQNYVLKDLVGALNDAGSPCPDKSYTFTDGPATGQDVIQVGVVYKASTLTSVGRAVLDDPAFTDPNGLGEEKNRAAIAETFEDADGQRFTVAVNHLKSKGSPCGAGDDDPVQGNCNDTRTKGAAFLADWLRTDPTGSGDRDVLILGDLNAYDKEDPIDALKAEGYADLLLEYQGEHAYTYVFDGQLGYLDYGMANRPLLWQVTGATAWHINADEPDILDYDTTYKKDPQDALYQVNPYRSSDHDPVIVGLHLRAVPVGGATVPLGLPGLGAWPVLLLVLALGVAMTAGTLFIRRER